MDENKDNDNAPTLKLKGRAKPAADGQQQQDNAAAGAGNAGDEKNPAADTTLTAAELEVAEKPATNAQVEQGGKSQSGAAVEPAAPGSALVDAPNPGFVKHVEQVREKHGDTAVEKIDVIVPKPFKLTLDNNTVLHFKEGVQSVHRFLAEHWYAKANGMKEYKRPQGQVQGITPEVYTEAVRRVRNGDIKLAYAITNIANYYHLPEEQVRAEMGKQLQPA